MSIYISNKIRLQVKLRAASICEYCLIHENFLFVPFHIDHIISIKHGGTNDLDNLAYSCYRCNRNKGTDLGSFLDLKGRLYPFFHPRENKWIEHFKIQNDLLLPLTNEGKVTEKIFKFNHDVYRRERRNLIEAGLFPFPDTPAFL